ncbi:MAG: tail fiber protein [Rhodanobacter sp.]
MTQPFVGEIRLFAFPRIPVGWFACDGSLKPISEYNVLFALIGTTFGGDGQTTFAVPDLRGRVPLHQGTGLGLTSRVMGQIFGTETVTLIGNQLPQHTHSYNAAPAIAAANVPTNAELGALSSDTMYTNTVAGLRTEQMAAQSVANAGGTGGGASPHDNTMPTLTASFCIAWEGIYPSQG